MFRRVMTDAARQSRTAKGLPMARRIGELTQTVTVKAPLAKAFTAFTERLGTWWPQQFTFGEEGFETAVVEPRAGGRWFERDVGGEELDWGEVRVWEPPDRLVLSWRVSPERTHEPPERASEVEVRFVPVGPAETRVELLHR